MGAGAKGERRVTYRFRRPRHGRFAHYCGECERWTYDERVSGGCAVNGFCEYDPLPDHKVSMAYAIALSRDQYEGACPLFARRGKHGRA